MLMGREGGDKLELLCPQCGTRVRTTTKEAEKGKVKCPRGHEFVVMGMLDAPIDLDRKGRP